MVLNIGKDSVQSQISGRAAEIRGNDFLPFSFNLQDFAAGADDIPAWSPFPQQRDERLEQLWRSEGIMAGAVFANTSWASNLPFRPVAKEQSEQNSETRLMSRERGIQLAQQLMDTADGGRGIRSLHHKSVEAFLTQDNGFFWEIVGPGPADGPLLGPPTQVNPMDNQSCYRTFDPEFPVFYRDPITFDIHKMHRDRVIFMAQMPSSRAIARGVGFCAVSRAIKQVKIMRNIAIYKDEKTSGRFTRAIGYGKGITNNQLQMMTRLDGDPEEQGLLMVGSIPFFATMNGVELGMLELAGIPDGFDAEKDTTLYVYALAAAFGIDAREIWPATASGATKADATVQHQKAMGKGKADILNALQEAWRIVLNRFDVEIEADYTDDEADQMKANIKSSRAMTLNTMKNMSAITAQQAQALAIAEDIIDGAVLERAEELTANTFEDQTPEQLVLPFGQMPENGDNEGEPEDAAEDEADKQWIISPDKLKATYLMAMPATGTKQSLGHLLQASMSARQMISNSYLSNLSETGSMN